MTAFMWVRVAAAAVCVGWHTNGGRGGKGAAGVEAQIWRGGRGGRGG